MSSSSSKEAAAAEIASATGGSSSTSTSSSGSGGGGARASVVTRVGAWLKRQAQDKILRTKNLTLLRNVGLFGLAVYFVRNNPQYVCPPPTENLTRLYQEQHNQMTALQQQHLASLPH